MISVSLSMGHVDMCHWWKDNLGGGAHVPWRALLVYPLLLDVAWGGL